jgi:hypothetical protein
MIKMILEVTKWFDRVLRNSIDLFNKLLSVLIIQYRIYNIQVSSLPSHKVILDKKEKNKK